MGDYRELAVWRRAFDLACQVYGVTNRMPRDERFGLTSQMRRAAVSIPSNLAEGAGRASDRDFRRFVAIARGSLNELVCEVRLSVCLGFLDAVDVRPILAEARHIGRMLSVLLRECEKAPHG